MKRKCVLYLIVKTLFSSSASLPRREDAGRFLREDMTTLRIAEDHTLLIGIVPSHYP